MSKDPSTVVFAGGGIIGPTEIQKATLLATALMRVLRSNLNSTFKTIERQYEEKEHSTLKEKINVLRSRYDLNSASKQNESFL